MSLAIKLKRADRIYRPGAKLSGVILVDTDGGLSHNGVSLVAEGAVKPQLSSRSVGIFEAFYSSIKPMTILRADIEIQKAGKFPDGLTEVPFELAVAPVKGMKLVETYHGVYVTITYILTCTLVRRGFSKDLSTELEFIVEVPSKEALPSEPAEFTISPDSLENVRVSSVSAIPKFKVSGNLHKTNCAINQPFTGELTVESSEAEISSIELQLVRVESVSYAEGTAREATEILNLQLADGDVCRKLVIPMYIIFPRLFTCPTTKTANFSVEFEMNLVVLFKDQYLVTENFPIVLYR